MGPLDLLLHLLGFAAPAAFVAAVVTLGGRLALRRPARPLAAGWLFAINFAVGLGASIAGLAWYGQDGRVGTYAALVLACASSHWLAEHGWRGR